MRVRLELPLAGTPTVQRLGAPSVSSTTGLTFANQHLTRAGTWAGAPRTETAATTTKGYVISVPGYSAAVITAQLLPGY